MARILQLLFAAGACCALELIWSAPTAPSTLYRGDCRAIVGSTYQGFKCEAAAFGGFLPLHPPQLRLRLVDATANADSNGFACEEAPGGTYEGAVVLVRRGGCGFQEKLVNVAKGGAQGMIVVNTDDTPLLLGSLEYEPLESVVAVAVTRSEGDRFAALLGQEEQITVTLGSSLPILEQAWHRIQHLLKINAPMVAVETYHSAVPDELAEADQLIASIRAPMHSAPTQWTTLSADEVAQRVAFFQRCSVAFGEKLEFTGDVSFHAAITAATLVKMRPDDFESVRAEVFQVAVLKMLRAGYYLQSFQLVSDVTAASRCLSAFIHFLSSDITSAMRGSSACFDEGRGIKLNVSGTGLDVPYDSFTRLVAFNKLSADDENCLKLTETLEEELSIETIQRRATCCRRRVDRSDDDEEIQPETDERKRVDRKEYSYQSAFIEELFYTLNIMGVFLDEIGAFTPSTLFFGRASRLCEDWSLSLEFRQALAVPIVFDSLEEMHSYMDELHVGIDNLLNLRKRQERVLSSASGVQNYADYFAHPADAAYFRYTITPSTMFVGYQGNDVLPLQRAIFDLRAKLFPSLNSRYKQLNTLLPQPEKGPKRRRIAFISSWFRNHSVGKLLLGIIKHLDRSKFHVLIYRSVHFLKHSDEWTKEFHKAADSYVELPVNQDDAVAFLRHEAIDVLVYPELGMDAWTLFLSHHRFAPVQCVFWGHPIPTANPSIDYFISSEYFVSDFFEGSVKDVKTKGQDPESSAWPGEYHGTSFSEQVVLFRGLSTFFTNKYQPPATPFDRATLHLPANARLYVCPQTLMKLHPDYDSVLHGILSQDPQARIILLSSPTQRVWKEQLNRRFRKTLGKNHRRVLFYSTLPYRVFMGLLSTADVMLDPFPFGGGVTTLDGLAVGTPVVTLPSAQSVPQLAAGFLRYMQLTETIVHSVNDYVTTAVRIAKDKAFRQQLQDRILAQHRTIYEDTSTIDDWNSFLEQVSIEQ